MTDHNGYPDNPDACPYCQLGEFLAKEGRCSYCGFDEEEAEAARREVEMER